MKSLYLILDLFCLAGPLFMAFEKKINFIKLLPKYLIALIPVVLLFIPWDIWFTSIRVWGFNPDYLTGIYIVNLPLEEWLFFLAIPIASGFIYENIKLFVKKKESLEKLLFQVFKLLSLVLFFASIIIYNQLYTAITFFLTSILVFYLSWIKKPDWFFHFALSYFIVLIPFLLINGALTGSFTESPIVWYNSDHIIGWRIFTIPIEDSIYNLLIMGMMVFTYEKLK